MSDGLTVEPSAGSPILPGGSPALAGWFGKIPGLGDFAHRRLPSRLVQHWDEWLSEELADCAQALGEAWPEAYNRAPALCFSAGAGVIDETGWWGVIVSSYDRVGREFPLTLFQRGQLVGEHTQGAGGWGAWIAVVRGALSRGCNADGLDAALAGLQRDVEAAAGPGVGGAAVADLGAAAAPGVGAASVPGLGAGLGVALARDAAGSGSGEHPGERPESEYARLRVGESAWWAGAAEERPVVHLGQFAGLPRGLYLRALVEQPMKR